jgi:hypothetical protein
MLGPGSILKLSKGKSRTLRKISGCLSATLGPGKPRPLRKSDGTASRITEKKTPARKVKQTDAGPGLLTPIAEA